MGKPTGFLEIERQDRGYEKPAERLRMSEAALAFSRAYQGATARIIDMLPIRALEG